MPVTRRAFLLTAAAMAGMSAALGLPGGADCLPDAGAALPAMLPFALAPDACGPATATPNATATATATPERIWLPITGG